MEKTNKSKVIDNHSFVVCAYKENPYLQDTIDSLLNQSINSEIVVSTSTPNDHIKDICEKNNIKLIVNPKPINAGEDWNYGYNNVEKDLITIVHQDDLYEPNFLEETIKAFEKFTDTQIVFTDYFELRNGKKVSNNSMLRIKRIMNAPFKLGLFNRSIFVKKRILSFGNPICCPAITYNKALLGLDIFDKTYINSCDYKTLIDLAFRKGRFVYVPLKLMSHRIYEESATTRNISNGVRTKEDLKIMEMLWPKFIAKRVVRIYAKSENLNDLDGE